MTYRLSIVERIAATTGLRPSAKQVLLALARSAHFETGMNAHPSLETLVTRSGLSRATVARCLVSLEADEWIIATSRRHRHATTYAIALDRLATNASGTKVVSRNDGSESQSETQHAPDLSLTLDDQSLTFVKFESQNETPIPSTYHDQYLQAPALRAGSPPAAADAAAEKGECDAPQPTPAGADLRANDRDHSESDVSHSDRRRADHPAPPGTRLPLRQGTDSPGAESAGRSGPQLEPQQQTFGPIDVSPAREPQWGQLAEALRKGLASPKPASADAKERKSG